VLGAYIVLFPKQRVTTLIPIFIFITVSFYNGLAAQRPGLDVSSSQFRKLVSPLNPSGEPSLAALVRNASTDAFHLAMLVGAALLLAGAIVNAIGIRNPQTATAEAPARSSTTRPAKEPA